MRFRRYSGLHRHEEELDMERHIVVGTSEQLQALGIKERVRDSWFRGYAMATYIDDELGYNWAETFFDMEHAVAAAKDVCDKAPIKIL